eukprot:6192359-Pleurochrysis_carterae.AAC.2
MQKGTFASVFASPNHKVPAQFSLVLWMRGHIAQVLTFKAGGRAISAMHGMPAASRIRRTELPSLSDQTKQKGTQQQYLRPVASLPLYARSSQEQASARTELLVF